MITINFIEKLIKFILNNQYHEALRLIDLEKMKLKDKWKKNLHKRLTEIQNTIYLKSEKEFSGQWISLEKNKETTNLLTQVEWYKELILSKENELIVNNIIKQWKKKEALNKENIYPVNKILFYWPPWTWKTETAKYIANKLDMKLQLIRLDEIISSYLWKTGKNIRTIFDFANKENTILFFDEIDTITKKRSDNMELWELKRIITVFLQNIDYLSHDSIVIWATNHPEIIDKALWRRFNSHIEFDLPNSTEIKELIFFYLWDNLVKNIDNYYIEEISKILGGLSGADIENIMYDIKREVIINDIENKLYYIYFLKYFIKRIKSENKDKKDVRIILYWILGKLKENWLKYKQISEISWIPYTTLKDNI